MKKKLRAMEPATLFIKNGDLCVKLNYESFPLAVVAMINPDHVHVNLNSGSVYFNLIPGMLNKEFEIVYLKHVIIETDHSERKVSNSSLVVGSEKGPTDSVKVVSLDDFLKDDFNNKGGLKCQE